MTEAPYGMSRKEAVAMAITIIEEQRNSLTSGPNSLAQFSEYNKILVALDHIKTDIEHGRL